MNEHSIGPILSTESFFSLLDDRIEGLKPAIKAAKAGELKEATHLFADFVRRELPTEKFFEMVEAKNEISDKKIKQAEMALRHELTSCGQTYKFEGAVDWFINPTSNKYGEWTWQLSRHWDISALAEAYRVTREDKYAEGAVELLMSWIRQATRPEDGATRGETLCWRTIECGIRMLGCWPDIIHSLIHHPSFTDEVILDVFKSIYEHGHRLINCLTHGNWLIMELSGVINISVLYPYFRECDEWREITVNRFLDEMLAQIQEDGFQYELTTNYHDVVLVNMKVVMRLTETYGYGVKKRLYDTMRKMLYVYVKLMQSGEQCPDINDGTRASAAGFIKKYVKFFPDDEVLRFVASSQEEGKEPDFTSSILKTSGFVSFRESWDKNATTAFFDAGKLGKAHSHEDKLNLLIYANGERVITEAGNYAYDSSDMRKYCVSSYAHNVCLIDGYGQSRRSSFVWDDAMLTEDEPVVFIPGERVDVAKATYDEGWGGEDKDGASHTRKVIFVRKPIEGAPYFIVIDDVTSKKPHKRTFLWHILSDSLETGAGFAECDKVKMLFSSDFDALETVQGQESPFRGWIANSSKQGDYHPVPTLNVHTDGCITHTVTLIAPKKDGYTPISKIDEASGILTVTYADGKNECFDI